MTRRQSHPIINLTVRGSLYQGTWTHGIHIAVIGSVTTELGMKRNAITLKSVNIQGGGYVTLGRDHYLQ